MTLVDGVSLAVAAAAYGFAANARIKSSRGLSTSAAAAFGPAILILGPDVHRVASYWLVIGAAAILSLTVTIVRRRSQTWIPDLAWSLGDLFLSSAIFIGTLRVAGVDAKNHLVVLGCVALAFLVYPLMDMFRQVVISDGSLGDLLSLPQGVGAYAVLLSTAGLIVLSFPSFGVLSFCVMTLPLWATVHELKKFQSAGETYGQTVRALGRLIERAGYVPIGHHERVAVTSLALAKEAGLPRSQADKLELVALLHDVGAASLNDSDDLLSVDRLMVARNGARVLNETGYLAGFAEILEEAGGSSTPGSLEARILRLANLYDEALTEAGSAKEALRRAQARLGASEPELLCSLQRVVAPPGR